MSAVMPGREGVSFEAVRAAVKKLTAEGIRATLRNVRAELGTGSLGTIQRHLLTLRGPVVSPEETATALSADVLRQLGIELTRLVAERTTRLELDLTEAQGAVELLMQDNEQLQTASAGQQTTIEQLRAGQAEHAGAEASLRGQMQEVTRRLQEASQQGEIARRDLALAQQKLEAAVQREQAVQSRLEGANQELVQATQKLEQVRSEAETAGRDLARLQTRVQSLEDTEKRLKEELARSETSRDTLREAEKRLAGLDAERTSLTGRLAETYKQLEQALANNQQLLEKVLRSAGAEDQTVKK